MVFQVHRIGCVWKTPFSQIQSHMRDKWSKMAHHHGGSSLVHAWEEFLSNCSRKVIVLYTLLRTARKPVVVTYEKDDVKKYKPV